MKKLLLAALILATSSFAITAYAESTPHPVEMGGHDCVYCHAPDSTSENKSESLAYSQWEQSRHGRNNVKCIACHSVEQDFTATPSIKVCLQCHPREATIIKRYTKNDTLVCLNCHTAHSFQVKPDTKSVHK